jgi:hypothetical protein
MLRRNILQYGGKTRGVIRARPPGKVLIKCEWREDINDGDYTQVMDALSCLECAVYPSRFGKDEGEERR